MKIVGIIPARYASTRFPGKPLADIHGKPMVWWVYQQAVKSKRINDVLIATDDIRIADVCRQLDIPVMMTSDKHETPTDRMHEVSESITSDLYIGINGDEPLIEPQAIDAAIPDTVLFDEPYAASLATPMYDPIEVIDPTNIKVVLSKDGKLLYMSRAAIPFPKGSLNYTYKKFVGMHIYNKAALDFYVRTLRGPLEKMEDVDLLRFPENGIDVKFVCMECNNISVDTTKDLEKGRLIIAEKYKEKDVCSFPALFWP
jgi:3-deoxy-manno-octulosonate cytidylyltransferase (CMP-KDO synthetase)